MNRSSIAALAVFLALAFLLLNVSPKMTRQIQLSLLQVIYPLLKSGSSLQERVQQLSEGIETLEDLERKTESLQKENERLRIENHTLHGLKDENDRLRGLLGFLKRSEFELLPAEVEVRKPGAWQSVAIISQGSEQGLTENLAILTDQGLVGKTIAVTPDTADVLLLTDENCKVSARIEGLPRARDRQRDEDKRRDDAPSGAAFPHQRR